MSNKATKGILRELAGRAYISEPHTTTAYRALCDQLQLGKLIWS